MPKIEWLGHDSFRLSGDNKVVYVDPWKLSGNPKADLILITHDHYDHFSQEDIAKISRSDTIVVAPPSITGKIKGHTRAAHPNDSLTMAGIPIQVLPAYNTNKYRAPGKHF